MTKALDDVIDERVRQVRDEGWTEDHDDQHTDGSLAQAAACYIDDNCYWPISWDTSWFKPKDRRRDLVRAAALIIAEIERLDRQKEKEKLEYGIRDQYPVGGASEA